MALIDTHRDFKFSIAYKIKSNLPYSFATFIAGYQDRTLRVGHSGVEPPLVDRPFNHVAIK